ncbi:MAG: hypothetical protein AAF696_26330, partial [Bacteroidota bacterium]
MIINLSYRLSHVQSLLRKAHVSQEDHRILDIAGICFDLEDREVLFAKSLDPDNSIRRRSLEAYTDFSAEASHVKIAKHSIRSLAVQGFSAFWVSDISIKHDHYHWGMLFFYLRELILQKPEVFAAEKEIYIVLEARHYPCLDWITSVFDKNLNKKVHIHACKKDPLRHIRWIRIYALFLFQYLRFKLSGKQRNFHKQGKKPSISIRRNYFVNMDLEFLAGRSKQEQFLHAYVKRSQELGVESIYFPTLYSFNEIYRFDWASTDGQYIAALPSLKQVRGFLWDIISCHFRLLFQKISFQEFEGESVPLSVIKNELIVGLQNQWFLFNALWYKSFFQRLEGEAHIFYACEFYQQGRALSAGIRANDNKRLRAYGIQHGIFNEAHTVY